MWISGKRRGHHRRKDVPVSLCVCISECLGTRCVDRRQQANEGVAAVAQTMTTRRAVESVAQFECGGIYVHGWRRWVRTGSSTPEEQQAACQAGDL